MIRGVCLLWGYWKTCASAQSIGQVQGAERSLLSPCSVDTIEKKKELVFYPIVNQKKKKEISSSFKALKHYNQR